MGINETRDKIVNVANRLFGRFGFQKTSMDEIARIAQKAKGSLYYHFSSKEELFREVVQQEVSEIKSALTVVLNNIDLSAAGKFKNYMLTRMELMQHANNYHETLHSGDIDHFEFMEDIRLDFDDWEKERLISMIHAGVERGEFNVAVDAEVLSEMFIMILKGLEIPFFIQGKYGQFMPHMEGMTQILLKGMK
ncbi:MAG: TetR/AcrR family transcriptional regulator [Bacteroidota bacterium]|nr:TetR/AcrR family transcriptional regulator [Bacteroidota bacterium]